MYLKPKSIFCFRVERIRTPFGFLLLYRAPPERFPLIDGPVDKGFTREEVRLNLQKQHKQKYKHFLLVVQGKVYCQILIAVHAVPLSLSGKVSGTISKGKSF